MEKVELITKRYHIKSPDWNYAVALLHPEGWCCGFWRSCSDPPKLTSKNFGPPNYQQFSLFVTKGKTRNRSLDDENPDWDLFWEVRTSQYEVIKVDMTRGSYDDCGFADDSENEDFSHCGYGPPEIGITKLNCDDCQIIHEIYYNYGRNCDGDYRDSGTFNCHKCNKHLGMYGSFLR